MRTLVLALTLFLSACSHTVEFKSVPQGAEVFLNGRLIGKTPLLYVSDASTARSDRVMMELAGVGRKELIEERQACTGTGSLLANLAWLGLTQPYCMRSEYAFTLKSN